MLQKHSNPRTGSIEIEKIPTALQTTDQWICWKRQERDGKLSKVPLKPTTGEIDSPTDPQTWSSFEIAVYFHRLDKFDSDGIGFVFTESDPFAGVDLDGCVDEQGSLTERASKIVSNLDSYAEYSPSETGVHILVKADLSDGSNRSDGVELYDSKRYFTVTGDQIPNTPSTVNQRQNEYEAVHSEYLGTPTAQPVITEGGDSTAPPTHGDEYLVELAMGSKTGDAFSELWSGGTNSYSSPSEADMALCCRLSFWTGGNAEQMDRMFRDSGLMRSKWDGPRGDQTYGERTIAKANSMTDKNYSGTTSDESTDNQQQTDTTIADVEQVVRDNFDEKTWNATEAVLSAHATLLLKGRSGNMGLILTGSSSGGKTTILKMLSELEECYRSDNITPASFVSQDASKSEEQLREIDLLPRIKQKSLIVRDMATWFKGDQENVRERMGIMAPLMDGEGYTRDSGSHGQRGYTGDEYSFNFIGATTPLSNNAWNIMGTVGNRMIFHEMDNGKNAAEVVAELQQRDDYENRVDTCRTSITDLLEQIWRDNGGGGSIDIPTDFNEKVGNALTTQANIIQHARGLIENESAEIEGAHRIVQTLLELAKGRAILHQRSRVTVEDMELTGRIALTTMPSKYRDIIRSLVDPDSVNQLNADEVMSIAGVSRPTAIKRMEAVESLGIGILNKVDGKGTNILVASQDHLEPSQHSPQRSSS